MQAEHRVKEKAIKPVLLIVLVSIELNSHLNKSIIVRVRTVGCYLSQ